MNFEQTVPFTIELHETDKNLYTPYLVIQPLGVQIHWSHGYHTSEQDQKFREEAIEKASLIVGSLQLSGLLQNMEARLQETESAPEDQMGEALEQFVSHIRRGPEPVIGFDRNGDRQKAFDMGWNGAKNEVWSAFKTFRDHIARTLASAPAVSHDPGATEPATRQKKPGRAL